MYWDYFSSKKPFLVYWYYIPTRSPKMRIVFAYSVYWLFVARSCEIAEPGKFVARGAIKTRVTVLVYSIDKKKSNLENCPENALSGDVLQSVII